MSTKKTLPEDLQLADNRGGGYGKPPRDRQFKTGTSGNPSGRPKGSLNLRAALVDQLQRRVQIREGDRVRTTTVFDAMVMSMIRAAGRGNIKLIDRILSIVSAPNSLTELMAGRPVFEFTPEEAARFSKERLLEGMIPQNDNDDEDVRKVVL